MTLQEKKKNHLHHLILTFRNQMYHSSWSLFPNILGIPNPNRLKWLNAGLTFEAKEGCGSQQVKGPRTERVWKETKPASLWSMYDTHTHRTGLTSPSDLSGQASSSSSPIAHVLLQGPPLGQITEFSLNPESLRHTTLLTWITIATLPKASHLAL